MEWNAEAFKDALELLIKQAAEAGYDLYVEPQGSVEVDRYEERFDLDSVGLTFSNQAQVKKGIDYATADETLYFIGMG